MKIKVKIKGDKLERYCISPGRHVAMGRKRNRCTKYILKAKLKEHVVYSKIFPYSFATTLL